MFLMLACSCRPTAEPDADGARGAAVQHNVTERGVVDQPRDLSAAIFSSGGRSTTGAPDGRFELVAADWLEMELGGERMFLPADAATPDLSYYHLGRGDVRFPDSKTDIAFEISGLESWSRGDSLQIVSPNVGMTMAGPESLFAAYPADGSTEITGQRLDWAAHHAPILDAGRGDSTWVAQMATRTTSDGTTYYGALARAGIASGFTVTDGRAGTLSAQLAPVREAVLPLHWKGGAFAALATQAGPGARPAAAPAIAIHALPETLAHHNSFFSRFYMALPTLVELGPISGSADFDEVVTYGDPFSSAGAPWTEFVTVIYAMPVPLSLPLGSGSLSARIVAALPVDALAGGAIAPPLSPVRNARIGGATLDEPRSGVGTAPTVAWDAPEIGAANSYTVTIHAIESSPMGVNVQKLATLRTSATSVELPGSLLAAGASYVLTITAIAAPGTDLAAKPFLGSLPYASADHVTAVFTP